MRKATNLFFPEKADNIIVTHWLKRGKTLREMNNAEMQAIEGPNFWNQVGEWLLFGLAFGIADRHLDNWVWSHELQKLAMIDTEMSFQTNLGLSDYAALFHHAPKLRETWDMHPETRKNTQAFQNVISGKLKMNKKIRENLNEIKKSLKEKGYSDYSSPWLEKSDEEIQSSL